MSAAKTASWAYAEDFVVEPPAVEAARARAATLGCTPVEPAVGALLRTLAATSGAKAAVEIGTGAGVSGLCLLDGMAPDGVLTTIDIEPMHQRAARTAFVEAGVGHTRTRLIAGHALDVLPRLADGAYDLVLVDADPAGYPRYAQEALRLLRPGGLLVLDDMLWHDHVADPANRDDTTRLLRDLGKELRDDERLAPVLLAAGDGVLAAVKR